MATVFFLCSSLFFLACQPNPKGGVVAHTYWTLATIKQGGKVAPMGQLSITLVFGEGELSGTAPCNSYSAGFSTQGTTLSVEEIAATKRMCDEMDTENTYLGLLAKAISFTVFKDRLEIYSQNGQLTFTLMPETEKQAIEHQQGFGRLGAMFPYLEGDLMPHLYPILRVDNPGNYPYKGTLVDTSLYRFFDAETAEIWNTTGGDVLAVGQYGGLFICRIPGRYVSSDIALFRKESGVLRRIETVAWAWCDEGWCNQQDAWLSDLNKDGKVDIVQRYTLTDDTGKVREERLTALVQDENGDFKEDKSPHFDRAQFVMAKI